MNRSILLSIVCFQLFSTSQAQAICIAGMGWGCTEERSSSSQSTQKDKAPTTLAALAKFGEVKSVCKKKQVALSKSLEAHVIDRIEEVASSALILELEEAMKNGIAEEIEPLSREEIKDMDWVYTQSQGDNAPKVIELVGQNISSLEKDKVQGVQTGVDFNGNPVRISQLSTDIKNIMLLAPFTKVSLEDQDLGTVVIHSDELSVKDVKVGRLFVRVSGAGELVNIEAEDVVWRANGVNSSLTVRDMKAQRVSITLNGTGSILDIDGLISRSANIKLTGTGTFSSLKRMNVKNLKYKNTGTGSFTRIVDSRFENMKLTNRGTGGAIHLFDVTANVGVIENTSTGADIFLDDVSGEGILFAQTKGTGGAIVGNEISYPVVQLSNSSSSALVFLNDVKSELLVTCNEGPPSTSASFLKDFNAIKEQSGFDLRYALRPPKGFDARHIDGSSNTDASDRLQYRGYMRMASKMPMGVDYATHIEDLDTKILVILDDRPVKAEGKTEILIVPRGTHVEGLEYTQRIDYDVIGERRIKTVLSID